MQDSHSCTGSSFFYISEIAIASTWRLFFFFNFENYFLIVTKFDTKVKLVQLQTNIKLFWCLEKANQPSISFFRENKKCVCVRVGGRNNSARRMTNGHSGQIVIATYISVTYKIAFIFTMWLTSEGQFCVTTVETFP